jgi:hypothetical protein
MLEHAADSTSLTIGLNRRRDSPRLKLTWAMQRTYFERRAHRYGEA